MSENPKKLIQNIQRLNGYYGLTSPKNTPVQYKDKQHEYLNTRNKKFSQNRAYLANDYVLADVQGLNPDDFYEWNSCYVRFSDIADSSSMASRKTDDWKEVMFPQEKIDYFPIGAKIETMGNTWLNVNPSNMGSAYATAVMARCNSAYNSYDYYGNIVTEPLYVGAYQLNKTATYTEVYHINLMDGNILITCQYNETTKRLGETKRLILGSKVYFITGYADYIQEFTGDRNSTHLITFTARVDEPTERDDMLETFIAGGKAEKYEAVINISPTVRAGSGVLAEAIFVHNDVEIASTEQYPVTWKYDSSNENVAQIATDGQITGISAGTATIRATMEQNPNIHASAEITVLDSTDEPYIEFSEYKDLTISQYASATYTATYYDANGNATAEGLEWSLTGADYKTDYSYEISANERSITITCNHASAEPLIVTATRNGVSKSISTTLEGY